MGLIPVPVIKERSYRFARGQKLPYSTDSLWLITKGVVKSYTINEKGEAVILGYWSTDEAIGCSLSSIKPYVLECITDVEVKLISFLQEQNILSAILRHAQRTEQLMCLVREQPIEKRFLHTLKWLAERFGYGEQQGQLINLRLTHKDLAELIGTTRVTITKLINHLEQEGIILRTNNRYILCDQNKGIKTG